MSTAPLLRHITRRRPCRAPSMAQSLGSSAYFLAGTKHVAIAAFTSTTANNLPVLETAASWVANHKAKAFGLALLGTPAAALVQGAFLLGRFRIQHGDAPVPIVPSHGLVAVNFHYEAVLSNAIKKWKAEVMNNNKISKETLEESSNNLQANNKVVPLRLLVIGDSLAAGVGTAGSCTPVLPQSIAKFLSKELNGRPVQWTCLGEPGASAGWIVNELEKQQNNRQNNMGKESTLSSTKDLFELLKDWPKKSDQHEWDAWWHDRILIVAREWFGFDTSDFGKYDVAVVLAGPNDFKMALLPFLAKSKDKKKRADFMTELMDAIEAVAKNGQVELKRVQKSVKKSIDNMRHSVEGALHRSDSEKSGDPSKEEAGTKDNPVEEAVQSQEETTPPKVDRPLIVLPSLPSKVLPVLRPAPVRWFTPPILGIMDGIKSSLAKRYPHAVLFVESPQDSVLAAFENKELEKHQAHDNIMSLSAVPPADCKRVLAEMQEYYKAKESGKTQQQHKEGTSVGQTGTVDPDSPGESLFSVDKVHPNDAGYDFWGVYIADAIVQEWRSSNTEAKS